MGDGRESYESLLEVDDVDVPLLSEESSDEEGPRKRKRGLSAKEAKAAGRKERTARIKLPASGAALLKRLGARLFVPVGDGYCGYSCLAFAASHLFGLDVDRKRMRSMIGDALVNQLDNVVAFNFQFGKARPTALQRERRSLQLKAHSFKEDVDGPLPHALWLTLEGIVALSHEKSWDIWIWNVDYNAGRHVNRYYSECKAPGFVLLEVDQISFNADSPNARPGFNTIFLVKNETHFNLIYWPVNDSPINDAPLVDDTPDANEQKNFQNDLADDDFDDDDDLDFDDNDDGN